MNDITPQIIDTHNTQAHQNTPHTQHTTRTTYEHTNNIQWAQQYKYGHAKIVIRNIDTQNKEVDKHTIDKEKL